jgi:hypothetical protein
VWVLGVASRLQLSPGKEDFSMNTKDRTMICLQVISLAGLLLIALQVFAKQERALTKEPLRVDFNAMIEDSRHDQKALHRAKVSQRGQEKAPTEPRAATEDVLDFIDMEVRVGNKPQPIVDRRFDSVGEARVVDLKN